MTDMMSENNERINGASMISHVGTKGSCTLIGESHKDESSPSLPHHARVWVWFSNQLTQHESDNFMTR